LSEEATSFVYTNMRPWIGGSVTMVARTTIEPQSAICNRTLRLRTAQVGPATSQRGAMRQPGERAHPAAKRSDLGL